MCYDRDCSKKDRKKGVLECMIKTYVIDTNVLIQAPYALECFDDNRLVPVSYTHLTLPTN